MSALQRVRLLLLCLLRPRPQLHPRPGPQLSLRPRPQLRQRSALPPFSSSSGRLCRGGVGICCACTLGLLRLHPRQAGISSTAAAGASVPSAPSAPTPSAKCAPVAEPSVAASRLVVQRFSASVSAAVRPQPRRQARWPRAAASVSASPCPPARGCSK
jgi:hypothetical protein